MDQSLVTQSQTPAGQIALLIDGENLGAIRAGAIVDALRGLGPLPIRRVYGDVAKIKMWEDVAGFRILHSGAGKNSADMLLSVDAMSLAFQRQVQHFIIASSDGDFSHLAHRLREMGLVVTGVGEARAPARFQKACTRFVVLPELARDIPIKPDHKQPAPKSDIDQIVLNILKAAGAKGLAMAKINPEMHKQKPDFVVAQHPDRTWRAYFNNPARAKLFNIIGKGAERRVALATS